MPSSLGCALIVRFSSYDSSAQDFPGILQIICARPAQERRISRPCAGQAHALHARLQQGLDALERDGRLEAAARQHGLGEIVVRK